MGASIASHAPLVMWEEGAYRRCASFYRLPFLNFLARVSAPACARGDRLL
ncbi:MAG: hypothetical protein KBI08_00960 [Sphingobium sp.]|nr:hypothetical protein [Sphingobium sp.]